MPLLYLISFLLLAVLSAPASVLAQSAAESRRQLETIEKRIRQKTENLEKKKEVAKDLEAELATVEKEGLRLQGRVAALEREVAALRSEQSAKAGEVGRLQENVARTEALVRRRLAALYKTGEAGTLRILFSANSPARAAEDYDFLERIVRRDRQLLADFRKQIREVEEARKRLAEVERKQRVALADLQDEQENLRRASRLKTELLTRTHREEKKLTGELGDLRERARRLSSLIKELESRRIKQLESQRTPKYTPKTRKEAPSRDVPKVPTDGVFGRMRGRLSWPAGGAVRVSFGTSRHPELGTLRESQGIEIAAPPGAPVSAVWPGTVIFAKPFKGFGNMLILDHGEGYYSLYAQTAVMTRSVGDRVRGGESIATSGAEGIYFEIRYHGAPLNPAEWLAPR